MSVSRETSAKPIARFARGWLLRQDRWQLYADRLEFQRWDMGYRRRYTFQLELLNPEMEKASRFNWKGTVEIGLIAIILLLVWLVPGYARMLLATRTHWLMGGYLIALVAMEPPILVRRCMLVLGITPARIWYGWGQEKKAWVFAQQVVNRVAEAHAANPESAAWGRGIK